MAGKIRKNIVAAEHLVSTHRTTETALFQFKTRKGLVELHLPRDDLADLIQAAGKLMVQPTRLPENELEADEPTDPKEMWVSQEAQQLVIRFTTQAGDAQAFRCDVKHGFHLSRLLMESASVGGMPWGPSRK